MRKIVRSGVYQIINEVNGKSYVGSSVDIDHRWAGHRYGFKKPSAPFRSLVHLAVRKYGIENFTFLVLEECEAIRELLLAREQYYIDTLKPEYNLLPKAGSRLGSKASIETIAKLRLKRHTAEFKRRAAVWASAYMNDPENKQRYSELRKGKTFAEIFGERVSEVLARQSAGRKGKRLGCAPWNKGVPLAEEHKLKFAYAPWTPERRRKLASSRLGKTAWNKGKPWSASVRQRLSIAHLGQRGWNTGLKMSEEFCRKQSQIAKARYEADPTHQQRITEAARHANTGKPRTEEAKHNISEGNLRSEKRKAYAESCRGVARTEDVKQKVSEALQTSEKAKAYHEGRIGKSRGNNPSGHYGVIWDKSRSKFQFA